MIKPDELLAMNDIHINIVGAANTGKSTLMLLIGRTLHENGFKVIHFTSEGMAKSHIFEKYRKAIEDISEKTKVTINEVQANRLSVDNSVPKIEENGGYIIESMGKIVDKRVFSTLEGAREYVFDSDNSVREISDEPNVFISNRSGRSSQIHKLTDYLIKEI